MLDRVVTFADPVFTVGDRNDDPTSRHFVDPLDARPLVCRMASPRLDLGGTLGVVASREDLPAPWIDLVGIGTDQRSSRSAIKFHVCFGCSLH